jgi:transposase InsO family protein
MAASTPDITNPVSEPHGHGAGQQPPSHQPRPGSQPPLPRIDSEEFYRLLQGQVIDDANVFSEKLQEWEDYYNYHRPHGALGGQTPYERLRQKAQDPLP